MQHHDNKNRDAPIAALFGPSHPYVRLLKTEQNWPWANNNRRSSSWDGVERTVAPLPEDCLRSPELPFLPCRCRRICYRLSHLGPDTLRPVPARWTDEDLCSVNLRPTSTGIAGQLGNDRSNFPEREECSSTPRRCAGESGSSIRAKRRTPAERPTHIDCYIARRALFGLGVGCETAISVTMVDRSKLTTDQWLPLLMRALMRDIASVMAQSVLYGAYLVFFSFAIYQLLLRHKRQRAFLIVSVTTLAMFVAGSFLWASNIAVLVQRLHIVFVEQDAPIADRVTRANESTEKMRYMSDIMFVVSYLIGDAVIGWRVLLLWQWKLWATIVISVMWLATAATGFGLIGCLVNANFAASGDLPRACTHLENTSWLFSLVYNGTVTALLAKILWNRYKRNETTGARRKNKIDRVLTVLVTSGIVYFILGLPRLTSFVNQTLNPLSSTTTYATQIIESMLYQLVNLYPTVVTSFLFAESAKLATEKTTVLEMTNLKGASRDTMPLSPTVGSPSSYGGSTAIAINVEKHSWMDEDRTVEKV